MSSLDLVKSDLFTHKNNNLSAKFEKKKFRDDFQLDFVVFFRDYHPDPLRKVSNVEVEQTIEWPTLTHDFRHKRVILFNKKIQVHLSITWQ